MSSKVKVRKSSLILNGSIKSTEEATKPDFNVAQHSNNHLWYVRAIQGHPGGELIALELMNHVAIPLRWKEFLYHVGSSFTVNSISQAGLFTPLDPFDDEKEEEYDDFSEPRKVHCKNKWKISQIAVYWVNLEKSTRQRSTILARHGLTPLSCDSMPADCIE